MLLQATLGLSIDGRRKEIRVQRPALPIGIEALTLRNLEIGAARLELHFRRIGDAVVVTSHCDTNHGVQVLTQL